jgi:2-hydroxychromene-2-carboxylate isomerase
MHADWYFDVISPFAYLQFMQLDKVTDRAELTLKPVLFAGLLNANGQKGPAEIPSKRLFTYQMVTWIAKKRGVPFKMPDAHPFNPICALRLCIALENNVEAVGAIYHAIWSEGHLPDNDTGWSAIQAAVGVSDGDALINVPAVKQQLIKNGEDALAANVFGVPSFVAEDNVFWGDDALGFFSDWLDDRGVLENPEMEKLRTLPSSSERPR